VHQCISVSLLSPVVFLFIFLAATVVSAQQNRIDAVTPAAPELAAYGPLDIGVRTIQVTDKNRPDILNIKEGGPIVRRGALRGFRGLHTGHGSADLTTRQLPVGGPPGARRRTRPTTARG